MSVSWGQEQERFTTLFLEASYTSREEESARVSARFVEETND
jgi:hypothetical protein